MQPGPRQPVPSSVVIAAGGHGAVALLSRSWSGPSIRSLAPDGIYSVGVSALANIVNAALGPDGLLYVSQLATDLNGDQPSPGSVLRVGADGTVEPVVEGLFVPHGIPFDSTDNLFIAVQSIISGPHVSFGQVLRVDGVATAAESLLQMRTTGGDREDIPDPLFVFRLGL